MGDDGRSIVWLGASGITQQFSSCPLTLCRKEVRKSAEELLARWTKLSGGGTKAAASVPSGAACISVKPKPTPPRPAAPVSVVALAAGGPPPPAQSQAQLAIAAQLQAAQVWRGVRRGGVEGEVWRGRCGGGGVGALRLLPASQSRHMFSLPWHPAVWGEVWVHSGMCESTRGSVGALRPLLTTETQVAIAVMKAWEPSDPPCRPSHLCFMCDVMQVAIAAMKVEGERAAAERERARVEAKKVGDGRRELGGGGREGGRGGRSSGEVRRQRARARAGTKNSWGKQGRRCACSRMD